jgi:16S rRNA processing protein RimM
MEVIMIKRFLETGQIVSTHGLKGEVNIAPWCDEPEFLMQFSGFYFDKGESFRAAEEIRVNKNLVIVKFEGVNDINETIKLIKSVIYLDRQFVTLPEGSYFEQDMLGLSVEDEQTGHIYGKLSSVMRTGANDVYGVKPENGVEVLIPAIKDVIKLVDIEGGRVLITPLKGLFDDED